jgi:hypothetical protein
VLNAYNLPGRVDAYLATLGPLVWREPPDLPLVPWEMRVNRGPARMRKRVVLTKIGMLGISVYDDWIACVFDDDAAGARYVGASNPSGKWNHHAFVGYCHKPTNPDEMRTALMNTLQHFCRGVEALTLNRLIRFWSGTCRPVQIDVWEAAEREADRRARSDGREHALEPSVIYEYWRARVHASIDGRLVNHEDVKHWLAMGGVIEDARFDVRR